MCYLTSLALLNANFIVVHEFEYTWMLFLLLHPLSYSYFSSPEFTLGTQHPLQKISIQVIGSYAFFVVPKNDFKKLQQMAFFIFVITGSFLGSVGASSTMRSYFKALSVAPNYSTGFNGVSILLCEIPFKPYLSLPFTCPMELTILMVG